MCLLRTVARLNGRSTANETEGNDAMTDLLRPRREPNVTTQNEVASAEIKRALKIANGMTEVLLKAIFNHNPSLPCEAAARGFISPNAVATLMPSHRSDVVASFSMLSNIQLIRRALSCKSAWEELIRLDEYDDRWTHSIRVQSDLKLDATDALERGRIVKINILFFMVDRMPELRSFSVNYEEAVGSLSPISLICARKVDLSADSNSFE